MASRGFGEKAQAPYDGDGPLRSIDFITLKIDSVGRVVIPADIRAAMLAAPGDTLTARVIDGELRIVSRAWVMRRINEEAARFKSTNPGLSVADEMIADRREETRLDDERWARLEREAAELHDNPERR
jgi:bifunctional DNA-binding transcriptional regulator/antitoxin component of YhaV-PrlF toxin-antitoxin module